MTRDVKHIVLTLTAALIALVAVAGLIFFVTGSQYRSEKEAVHSDIRNYLSGVAKSAAGLIDGDLHRTFIAPAQQKEQPYLDALKPLKNLLDNVPNIYFVYTVILKDGKYHFILDPTPEDKIGPGGVPEKSNIMDVYDTPSNALIEALSERAPAIESTPYTDQWGTFISAYEPIYDSKKTFVGVVGVDMELSQYRERMEQVDHLLALLLLRSLGIGLLAAFLAGFVSYRKFAVIK